MEATRDRIGKREERRARGRERKEGRGEEDKVIAERGNGNKISGRETNGGGGT